MLLPGMGVHFCGLNHSPLEVQAIGIEEAERTTVVLIADSREHLVEQHLVCVSAVDLYVILPFGEPP